MEGTPADSPPPKQPSSVLPALVVVGALVGFAMLLFLANFSMTTTTETAAPEPDKPFSAFNTKAPTKAKNKAKVAKVPEASLWVDGPATTRPAAPEGARNVVLVVLSAARKDHLTPYGGDPKLTPFLQQIATKGARFADALSTSPFARSAGTSLFTGQHAAVVDMVVPGAGPETAKVLKPEVETLAERLVAGGWRTYGVSGNFHRNTDTGLSQGFDRYRNAQAQGFNPAVRVEGERLVSMALDTLSKRSDADAKSPFLLQVDLIDAHAPLRVVPEEVEKFDEDKPNAPYRVAIHELDRHIQTLVEELEALGYSLSTNTYLVVISDHGEGNSDPAHHGKAHGLLLYETSVAIPWIVAGPDVPANRIISGLASSTDLMPTVLGLVGLAAPEGIDGQSWAAQLKGSADRTTRERAFADTWWTTAERASIWTEKMQCQKDYGTTGIQDAFATGCFDRTTDPDFKDLKQDPALLAELDAWKALVSKNVTAVVPSQDSPGPEGQEGQDAAPDAPAAGEEAEEEEEEVPEPGEQAG
jgi:arylsulfatase A-like enzyme